MEKEYAMKRALLSLVLVSVLLSGVSSFSSPAIAVTTTFHNSYPNGNSTIIETSGEGFLEERDGLKILHVKGSAYEMGYQHGVLACS